MAFPQTIVEAVRAERDRQERLWGGSHEWGHGSCADPELDPLVKMAVLAEEVGEVSRAVIERKPDDLRKELVQVAAVAVAWVESLP